MDHKNIHNYIAAVLQNMPKDWLSLTTHRLDIYDESRAKTQFLEEFEVLFGSNNSDTAALNELPTAYDYIRLGHPLSCVLEWAVAKLHDLQADHVIAFASGAAPLMAVLRANLLAGKNTRILYTDELPAFFDAEVLRDVYGFMFELEKVTQASAASAFNGSTVFIASRGAICNFDLSTNIDFAINVDDGLGSIIAVNGAENAPYIPKIQHVRRRETIAMTPADCVTALKNLLGEPISADKSTLASDKSAVLATIRQITGTDVEALVASSGLSMQYAIMMGLVHEAADNHPGKAIKILIPPNCYGGTNDQARRLAATLDNVEVLDLPVDAGNDMVQSVNVRLDEIAQMDAVPYIIAEIPTNPRVEVPDLFALKAALSKERNTPNGQIAVAPVFILDQTFCPNTPFLGEDDMLASVKTIAYVSGSKFPSGGRCTAGYCTTNKKAAALMDKIGLHLSLCDNEATALQYEILAAQMPSMLQRIQDAYANTRSFVNHIEQTLPGAKINFVSEALAAEGFTPSVFSLDLPTKGETEAERESYKRALNLKLINLMITQLPGQSKYCVSYGQLKGCYWTIPATSTQGTTKEGDKDYIVRVAVAPHMDLQKHMEVFSEFVKNT